MISRDLVTSMTPYQKFTACLYCTSFILAGLALGCADTVSPKTSTTPVKPTINKTRDSALKPTVVDQRIQDAALDTGMTKATSDALKRACRVQRRSVEGDYQKLFRVKKHTQCKKDSDCLFLPKSTTCADALCIRDEAPVNRRFAKKLKAAQYKADTQSCADLNQECAQALMKKRARASCKNRKRYALCQKGQCIASKSPRYKKKAPKKVTKKSPQRAKPKTKVIKKKRLKNAELLLGDTRSKNKRYAMEVAQKLMFGQKNALSRCASLGNRTSGELKFTITINRSGRTKQVRAKPFGRPQAQLQCIRRWLRSIEYPKHKSETVTVKQTFRYVAP